MSNTRCSNGGRPRTAEQ